MSSLDCSSLCFSLSLWRHLMLLDHCKWRQLGGDWTAQLSSPVSSECWGQSQPITSLYCVTADQSEQGWVWTPPPVWPLCTGQPRHRHSNRQPVLVYVSTLHRRNASLMLTLCRVSDNKNILCRNCHWQLSPPLIRLVIGLSEISIKQFYDSFNSRPFDFWTNRLKWDNTTHSASFSIIQHHLASFSIITIMISIS